MKIRVGELAAFIGSAALCLALPAFGQSGPYTGPALTNGESVTVQYTGNYSTTWGNDGAGIYSGTVNGSNAGIICDDFKDEITNGQHWSADAYQASSLTTANIGETLFGKTIGLDGYAEVATLAGMMFSGSTTYGSVTGITQAEISSAIWDITTSGGVLGLDSKATSLVTALKTALGTDNSTQAEAYLGQYSDLWILTPNPNNGSGNEPGQEMWTKECVPEGGTALLYLLLAGASCFGAMLFSSRNRLGKRETA
jgi:hypothetical protein